MYPSIENTLLLICKSEKWKKIIKTKSKKTWGTDTDSDMNGVSLLKIHDRLRNFNHDNNESDTSRNDSQTVTMHRHFSVITGDIYLL